MLIKILPRQKGFSLVELMISLTLGLVVIGGALSIVTLILATNTSTLKMTRLNQELRFVMMMLTRDLRRAGSYGKVVENILAGAQSVSNPFSEISVNADGDCILFNYDNNSDGSLNKDDGEYDERYGFRLKDKAIEIRHKGTDCGGKYWENITDERSIEITALKIEPSSFSAGRVTVRQYRITLTGHLKNDTTVERTLQSTVKVRNNEVLVN
jgi:prepilin peptidase dependent protein B